MAMEGADKNNFDKCGDELMSRELMERDTGRADDGQVKARAGRAIFILHHLTKWRGLFRQGRRRRGKERRSCARQDRHRR